LIRTPIVFNALEYLFKVVPSSKVAPKLKPCKRLNKVLKEVPTVSALSRVVAVTVANADAAYS
jgi:predicted nucleotidyltransferase